MRPQEREKARGGESSGVFCETFPAGASCVSCAAELAREVSRAAWCMVGTFPCPARPPRSPVAQRERGAGLAVYTDGPGTGQDGVDGQESGRPFFYLA